VHLELADEAFRDKGSYSTALPDCALHLPQAA